MDLLDYPVPELDITLQEASRILQLTLSPDQYIQYKNALFQQRESLLEVQNKFAAAVSGSENWVTEQFKSRLLSGSDPLPTSTALPTVMPQSTTKKDHLERAAALTWAVAKLYSEPWLLEGDIPTERTQQSEVFATSRIPGKIQDHIKVYPTSLHAILICQAGVFPIQILNKPTSGGPQSAVPLIDIYHQLKQITNQPLADKHQKALTVCSLSGMNRRAWYNVREEILKKGGPELDSLELMESAVLAISIEECMAPPDPADTLNAVKLGVGSCLRYYDKVVNLVVFKDSTAGLMFEHSAVDGMVAALVSEAVFSLSEAQSIDFTHSETDTTFTPPKPLSFPHWPSQHDLETSTQVNNPMLTFEIQSFPDVFTILRAQRGVFDAWINFSLQLALRQTLGESAASHILVTPTHVRHYKHGRCDPTYSMTMQSHRLVGALASCIGSDNKPQYTKELIGLFHLALQEHKNLIKSTKCGKGVGPHLAVLRHSMPFDNPLKKFLDPFGCPSIYLTGKDLLEGVECAVGNVYASDQLAVAYLGRKDSVRIVLNGKGSFAENLGKLQENLKVTLKLVLLLAVRYAIAGQMGAIEHLLNEKEESPSSAIKQNFTLLIHGGAGEEMMIKQKVMDVIEFALETALSLGAQILSRGGTSLDAVQKCVSALEDCSLFNAGKGAVFNRNGEHELEATIVDGNRKKSGSVACLHTVKNPVRAARKVMENSAHVLLVGEGAEEFLQGLPEKEQPVNAEYFHTDIRRRELEANLSGGITSKNNHPQTVGAVAVDHWGNFAAATSTGGLVGKWKGRIGDTAIFGAGIYADEKLALTCTGDGDVFLKETVAHKVATLYTHKGYSLREACREVIHEKGFQGGIIAVDSRGDAVIETNAAVMFVGSIINNITKAEVFRPKMNFDNIIWETDELVAYLQADPWTPGATILTQKALSGPRSIFHLAAPDFVAMFLGAQKVANLLCQHLEVQRCALVAKPDQEQPAHIRLLPLHGLEAEWRPHLAENIEFNLYDPGYCSSKSGPRCSDSELDQVQAKIRAKLPTPNAPSSYDFHGDPSHDSLFARIVRGEEQQWRVWEDNNHIAFLTPFPNTPGLTVLVPRKPLSSDIFQLEKHDYISLILAVQKVAHLLQEALRGGVALIFEGFEIDYAHAKLIPLVPCSSQKVTDVTVSSQFCHTYPGYVTSVSGPQAGPRELEDVHSKITQVKAPRTWEDPQSHATLAIKNQWYRNLFQMQNTLFHSTVDYFHNVCRYAYALTPITTDTISSPMGLGSDSEPVYVNMLGQDVYLADSMQFVLEYFLRFQEGLPGTYYISPSFRGEDPDATHLNQFYHVECELLGDMEHAMGIAEGFVAHMTQEMLKKHSTLILNTTGTLSHVHDLLKKLEGGKSLPRVTLEHAIPMMPSSDCVEWVLEGQPQFGRKLTRKGEKVLIEKYRGAVWLTEMDHLGVPFYQAYVDSSCRSKAKAADLLLGLGETIGLGERHSTPEMVQEALKHHAVPEDSYKWYINMRQVIPLSTSGWGMGTERYLCWLLQHSDVRDMQIIPRMKAKKYMP
ncbi:uncharacterized protein LOC114794214 [Denticeps clupeoides]|uniref:uncharacterized protein LOC114794214 n=1 Tax=Denticeps clupeoides TaxID=299321 RepID=UPI0010A36F65|nr:uncharacterized protein LOC114794214 [Denticeps clupeoides]XP_028842459.1 uncharacterized protein LOC114794214 [Denticeps clupeoides]